MPAASMALQNVAHRLARAGEPDGAAIGIGRPSSTPELWVVRQLDARGRIVRWFIAMA
jgi:hypothetical protein